MREKLLDDYREAEHERILAGSASTVELARQCFERSLAIIREKNALRGDCWRPSGLLGAFLEIHQIYFRLRNLIWVKGEMPSEGFDEWEQQILNGLQDMRNFTVFAELCLKDRNFKGEKYEQLL